MQHHRHRRILHNTNILYNAQYIYVPELVHNLFGATCVVHWRGLRCPHCALPRFTSKIIHLCLKFPLSYCDANTKL